jgi:hypothetical protein
MQPESLNAEERIYQTSLKRKTRIAGCFAGFVATGLPVPVFWASVPVVLT